MAWRHTLRNRAEGWTGRARRYRVGALLAAGVVALGVVAPQAQASTNVSTGTTAVGHGIGTSVTAVVDQLGAKRLARTLTDKLGDRAVGAFLDERGAGVVAVVNVVDESAARVVRTAGATPRLVRHGVEQLAAAMTALDGIAGVPNTAWGISPRANQVVLTVSEAAPDAGVARLVATADRFGDAVRVRHITGAITEQLYGGDELSTGRILCSAGFNVTRGGRNYVLTAGHCTQGEPYWQGVGPSVGSSFPGNDFGIVRNDYASAPGGVRLANGEVQPITKVGHATVGERVCKSGRTTGVTCGAVTGIDQTVNYGDGNVVYGLIKTDVYTDLGDSGGPLFDGSTGLGTVSGGNSTVDYFQPLAETMNVYGVSLAPVASQASAPVHGAHSILWSLLG